MTKDTCLKVFIEIKVSGTVNENEIERLGEVTVGVGGEGD